MLSPKPEPREAVPKFRFSPNPNKANAIRWYEWGPEAFNKAKSEKKPILLSISAVWCHWCHVMDETSYSDDRVIALINQRYVPIRVDADKRPDIQDRYLMGGWPTTAILTSNGEVLSGGTYIPPGELASMLERVSDYYQEHRDHLESVAEQQRRQLMEVAMKPAPAPYSIDRDLVGEVVHALHRSFDRTYGGFSDAPKFPNPPAIELLLRRAFIEDESYLLEMAALTLEHMAAGDIFDKEWGGFFRYATQRDWNIPHYEKMLGDNAALIVNYLHAYQVANNVTFRDIAERTLTFIDRVFADKKNGGFFGSQDADEEFYKLSAEERLGREMPYIDPIVYTDTNAMMVSTYIESYKVLGGEAYLSFALKTIDFLRDNCYSPGNGMAHYFDSTAHLFGRLADQAHMIGALIDAYGVTGNRSHLEMAKELVRFCEDKLLDADGAFFDIPRAQGGEELGSLSVKDKPVHDNAMLARQLNRLAYLDGDTRYEELATRALASIEIGIVAPIPAVAMYGLAVDEAITEPIIVTIIGKRGEPGMEELLREAWRKYLPGKETKLLDPIKDYETVGASGFPAERHPVVYPCIGRVCLPAVETPHEFRAVLEDLPGRPKQGETTR